MIYELGSWQHFVKRQDNIGLPIMEIKQKYLMEISKIPIDLLNINGQGGDSITVSSTPAPLPTTERYVVQDCVTGDALDTELYEIGEFAIEDRVTFNYDGIDTFGKVIGIAESEDYAVSITSTGVSSSVCYDNYVVLYSGNELGDNSVSFGIVLESINADFISNNNEYSMSISYSNSLTVLIYVTSEEGDPPYYDEINTGWSDTVGFGIYQYDQNQTYDLVYQQENYGPDESTISFFNQEIFITVSFENTNGYSEDESCGDNLFFRNSGSQAGSTFNMSYRNDNC